MRKRVFSVPAIISLVLMAAVLVFWHRGFRVRDSMELDWADKQGRFDVTNSRGALTSIWRAPSSKLDFFIEWPRLDRNHWSAWSTPQPLDGAVPFETVHYYGTPPTWHTFGGAIYVGGPGILSLTIPIWWLLPALAVLPGVGLLNLAQKRRRHASGLCIHCGYDLRHSPDRCPECGSAVHTPDEPVAVPSAS